MNDRDNDSIGFERYHDTLLNQLEDFGAFEQITISPEPSQYIFQLEGREVGRLYLNENGELEFEGNAAESAKAFFEYVRFQLGHSGQDAEE